MGRRRHGVHTRQAHRPRPLSHYATGRPAATCQSCGALTFTSKRGAKAYITQNMAGTPRLRVFACPKALSKVWHVGQLPA